MRRSIQRSPVLRSSYRHAPHVAPTARALAKGAPLAPPLDAELTRLALASSKLAVGYSVIARHSKDRRVVSASGSLASVHRALAADLAALVAAQGKAPPRIASTCGERLRWEWLASAGRLMDGSAESRLVAECARLQKEADAAVAVLGRSAASAPAALRRVLAAHESARGAASRVARVDS